MKREEFCSDFSDFEPLDHHFHARDRCSLRYIYMTVLGFAKLHALVEALSLEDWADVVDRQEITKLNNGENFTRNPGVQLLERASYQKLPTFLHGSQAPAA